MPTDNWTGLGEMLVRRRIELDPRYSNRQTFADERGVSYRIVSDIERGRRGNYEPATIAALEVAYGLAAGSIGRALAGGGLDTLPQPAPAPRSVRPVLVTEGDGPEAEFIAKILGLLGPRDREVVKDIMNMVDGEGKPWSWERKRQEIEIYAGIFTDQRNEAM